MSGSRFGLGFILFLVCLASAVEFETIAQRTNETPTPTTTREVYIPDPNQCVKTLLAVTAPDAFYDLADAIKTHAESDANGEGLQAASEVLKAVIRWAGHWETRCAGRYMSAASYDEDAGWDVIFNPDQYLVEAVVNSDLLIEMKTDGACQDHMISMDRRNNGQRTFAFLEMPQRCEFDVFVTTDSIHWEVKFHRLTNVIPPNF